MTETQVDHAIASVMTRPSFRLLACAILGVGLLCAIIVLYKRMNSFCTTIDQMNTKIDTLARLAESEDGLVDEPLPVEDANDEEVVDELDMMIYHTIQVSDSEEEEDKEEEDAYDLEMPRVEELPSPPPPPAPPVPMAPKKTKRKSPKPKAVVFDLDAVMSPDTTLA